MPYIVYENPSWISNGKLSRRLKTHSLSKLQSMTELIPYKRQFLWVPEFMEDGLESWARYPCALSVEDTREQKHLIDPLWRHYKKVMLAYGRKMERLLAKDWCGPDGVIQQYKTTRDFFFGV